MEGWNFERGPESDVVISSRVRLARNFKDYPFVTKMNSDQEEAVLNETKSVLLRNNHTAIKNIEFIDTKTLNPLDKQVLLEKHLISPDFIMSERKNGLFISKDEKISIMVNEEDHLRIQCLLPGMQLEDTLKLCTNIDTFLEKNISFAFSRDYGYLTCCPTNVGTGMRASVMLHLPAITMTGYIKGMLDACSKLGVAVRGIYGENSESMGNMFQVSNQVTLGLTEEEIITNISNLVFQIIEQERKMRKDLYKQNPLRFEDKIYRSLGLFSNARIISTDESLKLLSDVRLGVDMGIINDVTAESLNEIMLIIQPANLQKILNMTLSPEERDIKRAEIIKIRLNNS